MKKDKLKALIATPGKKHKVKNFATDYTAGLKKAEGEELLKKNIEQMISHESRFYADDSYSLLLIFQAMDAAGKDGTIKHVMSGVNPQSCMVYSFKQPSAEELDHDYMWRILKNLPERGRIGIFNRSHYEEVLVAKVHPEIILKQKLPNVNDLSQITEDFWTKRYRQINDIEKYLTENGTVILKFFLNVSKDEQKKRFMSRLNDEKKNWKFSMADIKERGHWDDYMNAYSDMLTNTSTDWAPWHVIPADNKWFMRCAVGDIICNKLESLNVKYPELSEKERLLLVDARETLENEGK